MFCIKVLPCISINIASSIAGPEASSDWCKTTMFDHLCARSNLYPYNVLLQRHRGLWVYPNLKIIGWCFLKRVDITRFACASTLPAGLPTGASLYSRKSVSSCTTLGLVDEVMEWCDELGVEDSFDHSVMCARSNTFSLTMFGSPFPVPSPECSGEHSDISSCLGHGNGLKLSWAEGRWYTSHWWFRVISHDEIDLNIW